jgi:hypothetical protein
MKKDLRHDIMWIVSEICYYFGLVLAAMLTPLLTLVLWMMDLADILEPNYWHLLTTWVLAVSLFLAGVILKNRIYSL